MKTINVTFSDKEYEKLSKVKGKMNWHNFILILIETDKLLDRIERDVGK